jgi:hypothetical protein
MAVAAATTKIPLRNSSLVVVIPSDSTTYNPYLSAVYIGGATGDVALTALKRSADGVLTAGAVTYTAVPAGTIITGIGPIEIVKSTGTTATGIIGIE